MAFLGWLESLSFAVWVRESPSLLAFPSLLFIHTLGMSLVAGGSAVISMALLGFWPKTPLKPLERLYRVMWFGFWVNLFTRRLDLPQGREHLRAQPGSLREAGVRRRRRRPAEHHAQAGLRTLSLDAGPVSGRTKMLAWASLACWFCAIVAGRLIAYVGPVPGL